MVVYITLRISEQFYENTNRAIRQLSTPCLGPKALEKRMMGHIELDKRS
jgi:hypothetical protein